jgi:hypothetical protein
MHVRTALSVLFNDDYNYCDYILSVNNRKEHEFWWNDTDTG